jgi:hypothetical protein
MDKADTGSAGFLADVFGATAAEETPVVAHQSPRGRDAMPGRHRTRSQWRRWHRGPAVAAATVVVAVASLGVLRPGAGPNPAVGPAQNSSRPTPVDAARTVPADGDTSNTDASWSSAQFRVPPPPAAMPPLTPPAAAPDTTGPEPAATTTPDIAAAQVPGGPLAVESSMAGQAKAQLGKNKIKNHKGGRGDEGSPRKAGKAKPGHGNKRNH